MLFVWLCCITWYNNNVNTTTTTTTTNNNNKVPYYGRNFRSNFKFSQVDFLVSSRRIYDWLAPHVCRRWTIFSVSVESLPWDGPRAAAFWLNAKTNLL